MDSPDTSTAPAAGIGLRRRLIGAGLVGLTGSLLPTFATRSSATAPPTTPTTSEAPRRPTTDDVELLAFAQTVELAAVALYDGALGSGILGEANTSVVRSIRQSHLAYGQSLSALLGRPAPGVADRLVVDAYLDAFSTGSEASIATAAVELENVANATHLDILGQLSGLEGAQLTAAIAAMEARHAVVFADIAGESDLDVLLTNEAEALAPGEG